MNEIFSPTLSFLKYSTSDKSLFAEEAKKWQDVHDRPNLNGITTKTTNSCKNFAILEKKISELEQKLKQYHYLSYRKKFSAR